MHNLVADDTSDNFVHYSIDGCVVEDNQLSLKGWCIEIATGLPPLAIILLGNDFRLLSISYDFTKRIDVHNVYKPQVFDTGFNISTGVHGGFKVFALLQDKTLVQLHQYCIDDHSKPLSTLDLFLTHDEANDIFIESKPLLNASDVVESNIDEATMNKEGMVIISGWCFQKDHHDHPVAILAVNEKNTIVSIQTSFTKRLDVLRVFGFSDHNLNHGFAINFERKTMHDKLTFYAITSSDVLVYLTQVTFL